MSEMTIAVLGAEDWQRYRDVRLAALKESPHAFTATYEEEADLDEDYWRERMTRSLRFLAEQDGIAYGVVSLGRESDDPTSGEVFGLYVTPEARNTGLSWRLVQAAADRARDEDMRQIHYWVGSENARAIAFAANFGFRPAGERRTTRISNEEFGDQEVAMVLSLMADPGSVPNPNRGKVTPKSGPLR
ncbi:MAG: GNAT family N-acetyltransferase [Propionibacteriaceae bacterium]